MEEKLRVPGTNFDIVLNSVYQIVGKTDLRGAPSGYNEIGSTKIPNYNITTTVHPKFDVEMGIWDTGLDETSSCFRGMDKAEVKEHLKNLKKHIIDPLSKRKNKDFLNVVPKEISDVIRNKDDKGLDNHSIVLGIDRFFDTSKPEDLFNLFTAIYNKDLCPKDEEFNAEYLQADYCVVNDKQKINTAEQKQFNKDKAIAKLINQWGSDKKKALQTLKYCGISVGEGSREETVVSFFRRWLDDKSDRGGNNSEYYLDRVSRFSSEEGEQELYIYTTLQEMVDKKEVTIRNGEYFHGSKSLGNSLKTYAEKASKDEELAIEILGAVK